MRLRPTALLVFMVALGLSAGCPVSQHRGEGLYKRVTEPRTGAVYHMYLPVDYVRNNARHPNYPKVRRWPLVMTFHGMKPYDNAIPQEREWEKEADFYGYVVCAPELETCDSFMEYPLTTDKHGYVQTDVKNVLAIMDHVYATTLADPKRVLSTSWSCGGYFAHYFPNRFPDRFSCIATRLSNFSAEMLREDTVRRYRKMPVALFIGDDDFAACKSESQQAVAWYTARDFEVVRGKMIDHMGHRRIPQTAAAFFAEQIGITPLHPIQAAQTVAQVQMTEYYPPKELIAQMRPKRAAARRAQAPVRPKPRDSDNTTSTVRPVPRPETRPRRRLDPIIRYVITSAGRNYPFDRQPIHNLLPAPTPGKRDASKSPPTAAGSTAVASAKPTPRNRLDPVRAPEAAAGKPKPTADRTQRPKAPPVVKKPEAGAEPAPSKPAKPPQPFAPKNAGPRDYSRWLASNLPSKRRQPPKTNKSRTQTKTQTNPQAKTQAKKPSPRNPSPRKAPAKKATPTPKATPSPRTADAGADRGRSQRPPEQRRGSARRVNINIKGPAVGSAPYYLSYAVDLPPDVLRGADLLWKDNGVWMGDAPLGAKILESPGVHRITVLLVTRDNKEYRGMATVRVLDDAAPTLTSRRPRQ